MNPKMLASFVDGSKAMIEMACTGQRHRPRGEPRGHVRPADDRPELANVFRPAADGGVLDRPGVVDYCHRPGGAGRVRRSSAATTRSCIEEMDYLKMGAGPYSRLLPALPPGQHRGAADGGRGRARPGAAAWRRRLERRGRGRRQA